MSRQNYIELYIDGQKADIDPSGQVPTISYQLEDEEDFEKKKSAESFDIELPATEINDQIHNTLHNPSVLDNTANQVYDNFRPLRYIGNGQELLIGKYLVQSVIKKNGRPEKYKGKAYGLNGDWAIDLKEKTLSDFINPRTHLFDANTIIGSWSFDGRNEATDFVYAPVRYLKPFGNYPAPTVDDPNPQPLDDNVLINDMKLSLSIYWILWRGFKSVGYRIVSQFMDTDYYRRSLLPWTWGGFDFLDDSRWEPLKFVAGQPDIQQHPHYKGVLTGGNYTGYPDLQVKVDPITVPGSFDNSGLFQYTNGSSVLSFMMMWTYGAINLGKLIVNLSVDLSYFLTVANNSDIDIKVQWYKNGVMVSEEVVDSVSAPTIGNRDKSNFGKEIFFEGEVNPGDYIGARVRLHHFESGTGSAQSTIRIDSFQLNFIKLGDGSTIDLIKNYPKFKTYKWMDLLRGEVDFFDLSIQTDPIKKEVYIEPTHGYDINGTPYSGYYNRKQIDWSQKVNLSEENELTLFSDYERELVFKFQDDTNDGGLKKVQDRNQATIGLGKYVLPERYKSEKKERENRFYSPVMHYENRKFQYVTGVAPQLIALIPENISNTSASESENTYNPKRVWYKGNVTGYGGWRFNGINYSTLPYMFAVNYKAGGEHDPVLSYSDQLIGGVIAIGLLKKFFLQRMAILRNGRRYQPINIKLNNYDVGNFLHRESIIIENLEYLLTSIQAYNPMESDESTACNMWMFLPVSVKDANNTYPSIQSIRNSGASGSFDVKYWPHLLLTSDIPK
jgi:hypothetical protein